MDRFIFYQTTLLFTLVAIQGLDLENAYNNCLIILGHSSNNVYKESLVKKILKKDDVNLDTTDHTTVFRMLTKNSEEWKSLITNDEQTQVQVQKHDIALSMILVYEGTNEMNLKQISFLSKIIQNAKHFALVEIGEQTAIQTMTLLYTSAQCTHTGHLQIHSPHQVYFCNGIDITAVPFVDETSIEDFKPSEHHEKTHMNSTNIQHSLHKREMHHTTKENSHGVVKQKKKKPSKQKIEELKLRAKRARKKHHPPEKVIDLPVAKRKLLCKYRKSCYDTGIIPNEKILHTPKIASNKETEENEMSEVEIKLACKYRKSCYAEIGADDGQNVKPKRHRVLTAKARAVAEKPKKKKTLKDIADKALEQIKRQEMKRQQLPKRKKARVERKLNETETMKLKLFCKYRKSCYDTGKTPEVIARYDFFSKFLHIIPEIQKTKDAKNFTDFDDFEKKIYCKYRKSCYESGVKPTLKNATELKIKNVMKKSEEQIPLEIRCKYRKSCYETKIPPQIKPVRVTIETKKKPSTVIETLAQLKLYCRYRKSCYEEKVKKYESREFARAMEVEIPANYTEEEVNNVINITVAKISEPVEKSKNDEAKVELQKPTDKKEDDLSIASKTPKSKTSDKIPVLKKKESTPIKKKRVKRTSGRATTIKSLEETKNQTQKSKKTDAAVVLQEPKLEVIEESIEKFETENATYSHIKKIKKEKESKKERREMAPKQHEKEREEMVKGKPKKKQEKIMKKQAEKKQEKIVRKQPEKERDVELNEPAEQIEMVLETFAVVTEDKRKPTHKYATKTTGVKTTTDKLSCKYRKSCYGKGKKYKIIKDMVVSEKKKPIELKCKYRKSCYKTGQKPEIKNKPFGEAPIESIIKNIYKDEKKEHFSESNKKLYCKYRKSCYGTGKLPTLKKNTLKNLADTDAYTAQPQLRCKYRKSCYKKSNIILDEKIKKLKNGIKREEDVTVPKENVQTKSKASDEKRRGASEKKVKKDERKDEEKEEKSERKSKNNKEQEEEQYRQIRVSEPQTKEKQSINSRNKLSCKYRKRCYEGQELLHSAPQKPTKVLIKDLRRPNGKPCSVFYISCRKMAGLPIRQRPPIGPSGKRLCKKKPKNANNST